MISRKQAWALLALTLMWGVNWPMMKLALQEITPLMFRASTMLLGAGWPFWLGGITPYLDRRAAAERATGHRFLAPGVASLAG